MTADPRIAAAFALTDPAEREAAIEQLLEENDAIARRKVAEAYQAHLDFHGVAELRMITVGRRRGYKGQRECADCYHGRPWR